GALGETIGFLNGFGITIFGGVCGSTVRLSGLPSNMSVAAAYAVKHNRFAAPAGRLRFRPEIELDRLPRIAPPCLEAEAGGWLVTAIPHAILATAVTCDTVHHAVSVPFGFLKQFRVARVMLVGH